MISRERLIQNFMQLAGTDSPSFEERKIATIVEEHLKKLQFDYFEDDTKTKINGNCGNIICHVKGDRGLPPILIAAHMDTVGPNTNKKPVIDGDIIRTDGTTTLGGDDLAGVSILLELLYAIAEEEVNHGDITAVFTVAEEKGLLGSKNLDLTSFKAQYGFILDDGGSIGSVTYSAPFQNSIKAVIKGRAAHAGVEPEKGINAIMVAAHALSTMKMGRIDPETTSNIGIISGGSATNVVCEQVEILGEVRSIRKSSLMAQTEHLHQCFQSACETFGARLEFTSKEMYSGYRIPEDHPIIHILKDAAQKSGLELKLVRSGGGSDTNIFNGAGIPSVNLSVGMEKVHTVEEFIRQSDMFDAARFLMNIVTCIK